MFVEDEELMRAKERKREGGGEREGKRGREKKRKREKILYSSPLVTGHCPQETLQPAGQV